MKFNFKWVVSQCALCAQCETNAKIRRGGELIPSTGGVEAEGGTRRNILIIWKERIQTGALSWGEGAVRRGVTSRGVLPGRVIGSCLERKWSESVSFVGTLTV